MSNLPIAQPFFLRQIARSLPILFASLLLWLGVMSPAIALPTQSTLALFHFSGTRPANLGVQNGVFTACASTPNCVSSQSQDTEHTIAPLRFTGAPDAAFSQLKATVRSLPRTQVITETPDYLYAEFTSQLMGFVDDVEFALDRQQGVIQVRSASRLGESDLGVNRQRIEAIRTAIGGNAAPQTEQTAHPM